MTRLGYNTQPGSATAGAVFGVQPVIKTQDQFGNNSASGLGATVNVTVSLTAGTGALQGTATKNIGTGGGNGTATYTDLRIDTAGGGKELTAAASGLTSALSGTFAVNAAAASILVFTTHPGSATYGSLLSPQPVLKARDPYGNDSTVGLGVSKTVTLMLTAGAGALTGTTSLDIGTGAGNGTVTFADLKVNAAGTGKQITAAASSLTSTVSSSFTINPLAVTVAAVSATKPYDGGTNAAGTPTITPALVGGDTTTVLSQAFQTKHTGSGNKVIVPSVTINDGNSGANYTVTLQNFTTGTINPLAVTVTAAANSKTYDGGTNAATAPTYAPALVGSDTANFTETYDTRHVGTGKTLTPAGTVTDGNSGNNYSYTFIPQNSGTIAAKDLSVGNVTANDKVYDGTTVATLNLGTAAFVGVVGGDTVTIDTSAASGSFANSNAGVGKTVMVAGIAKSGAGADNYSITQPTTTASITKATPAVTMWPTAGAIAYGQTLAASTLSGGSSTPAGSFAFTTPTTAPDVGTAAQDVTFTPTDTANYNTAAGTVNVTVNKANPSVTTWPTASAITYGQTLADSALSGGSATPAGSFAFTIPSTVPSVGTNDQSVTFTPTDTNHFNAVLGAASVVVNSESKANPTVTVWPTASAITYGQTLADSTLSGGSATPVGSFAFTTPSTAPTAGTVSQGVTFTPTDTTRYNTAAGSVSVTVNKATPMLTVNNSPVTYNGSAQTATVNGSVGGAVSNVKYDGLATVPTTVGTYAVTANFTPTDTTNYSNLTAAAAGNFVIDKATPTVTVTGTMTFTDNGTPQGPGTVTMTPASGGAVTYTYAGTGGTAYGPSQTKPSIAGSYSVTATVAADANCNAASSIATDFTIATATSAQVVTFSNSGSWTVPTTINQITVELWGGGGGGGGDGSSGSGGNPPKNDGAGGGGGGAYARINALTVTPGNSYSITVGSGGTTGSSSSGTGGTGESTTFNTNTCVAAGGAGGQGGDDGNGGSGGQASASTGDVKYNGGSGATGAASGGGGGGSGGTNSSGNSAGTPPTGAAAVAGGGPGGDGGNAGAGNAPSAGPGGGGGGADKNSANVAGGTGAPGFARITYKLPATVTLGSLTQTYTGSPLTPTATTVPAGLNITWTSAPQTAAGIYSVTATINDPAYQGSAAGTFTINKATPTATLAVNNSPVAYDGTPKAATVGVSASSVPGAAQNILTGGAASRTNVGTYAVTADFVPTDSVNYNTLSALSAGNFVIDKATPVVTWSNPANITYGTALSGTQLNAAAGGVAGSFVYTPASGTVLNAGANQTLSVQFTPTDTANYSTPSAATVSITVNKATPTLAVSNSPVTYDGTARAATVSASVAGTVSSILTGGAASQTAAGTYAVTADFEPTDAGNFNSLTGGPAGNFVIQKATLTVTADNASRVYGAANPAFTASYTGFVNGETLPTSGVTGSPSLTTTATTGSTVADSPYTITAALGSLSAGNYAFAFAPGQLAVTKADSATVVSSSLNPSVFNQSVTFTATVSAVAPGSGTRTGTVQFRIDGADFGAPVALSGGVAVSGATAALAVGTHVVTAVYSGDGNFNGSTAPDFTQTVNSGATTTALAASTNTSVYGQPVTFTATVSGSGGIPSGTVQFKIDGVNQGSPVSLAAGVAVSSAISSLATGLHAVVAVYSGDGTYAGSTSAALSLTVNKAAATPVMTVSPGQTVYGEPMTLTATVSAQAPSAGIPTGTVTFYLKRPGGEIATVALNGAGVATITTRWMDVGHYSKLHATYNGDGNFIADDSGDAVGDVNRAATTTTVASSLSPSVYGQAVTFTATVAVVSPGAGIPSGTVTFTIDGVAQPAATLNASGQATFTTSALTVGSHTVSAAYATSASYSASSGTLAGGQTVTKASSSTAVAASVSPSVYGQSVVFTATAAAVAPGTGMPTGTVTFAVDGTSQLPIALDGTARATFAIATLSVGSHSVSASYSGDSRFLASASGALTQVVNPTTVTGVVAVADKVYDATTAATIVTRALTGVVPGDDISLSGGAAAFADKHAGSGKPVTVTGLSLTGSAIGNYLLASTTVSTTASISRVNLTGSITASNKVYDGTVAATIATRTLTGVLGAEVVNLEGGAAAFADKHAGSGKAVTATGLVLAGADAGNYQLASTTAVTAADITERPLSVTATGVDKVYDGATDAAVILADNRVAGDVLDTGHANAVFADPDVGVGKAVSVSGISLSGADAANYSVNATAGTTAAITPRTLTVTVYAADKIYDGTTAAVVTNSALAGIVGGDAVTLTVGAATFADKDAGVGKLVTVSGLALGGAGALNYALAAPTATCMANIAPALLTVTAEDAGRAYRDPDPAFSASLAGFIGGEVLGNSGVTGQPSLSTPATLTSPVGDYPLVVSIGTLAANNYTFQLVDGTLTITAGPFLGLQVLVPGETAAPGTASGKSGAPVLQTARAPFEVTVNAVDAYWNVVTGVTDVVRLTATDAEAGLPADAPLVAGTLQSMVTLRTLGAWTFTAEDVTDGSRLSSTSAPVTVVFAPPSRLGFTVEPMDSTAGVVMAEMVVQVQDAYGNPVPQEGTTVALALNGRTVFSGILTKVSDVDGRAVFSGLEIRQANDGLTFTAQGAPYAAATSSVFSILPAEAAVVQVETLPSRQGQVVPALSLKHGRAILVYSNTRDAYTNFVANVTADEWSLESMSGGIGPESLEVQPNGRGAKFTATAPGTAVIRATSGALPVVTSGLIEALPPNPVTVFSFE